MVVAVLVHLDRKEIIPLAIAPIVKQDGETKNDCERNALKQLFGADQTAARQAQADRY